MEREFKIKYSITQVNGDPVLEHHKAELNESFMSFIGAKLADGYVAGEFNETIEMIADEKETDYTGLWSIYEIQK